jgi:hypothetical protein
MCGLIIRDFLKIRVEWVGKPSFDELGLGVVGKTFSVEFVLKVLEC